MSKHALSDPSLNRSAKLTKATFPDSEIASKMSCWPAKGKL